MIRNVSTNDTDMARWIRSAALAINSLVRPKSIFFDPCAVPDDPIEGQAYYDSTSHKLRVWDGSAWQNCW